jgi:Oxidoreductase molybdopterin binding domain
MKRLTIITAVLFALILGACASNNQPTMQGTVPEKGANLLVSGGDTQKSYSRTDLEALPSSQAAFKDVTYVGVSVSNLLKDAGFEPQQVQAVKAVASDGFTVNYDPSQFLREDFLVAYAQASGDLAAEDGAFRMVLPDAEGKLNLRMLVELQVVK